MANRALDLTGQKFGKLVAVRITARSPRIMWLCECECGGKKEVHSASLKACLVKSCGCLKTGIRDTWKAVVGTRVEGWECVKYVKTTSAGQVFTWRHECGREVTRSVNRLKSGALCSCLPRHNIKPESVLHAATRNTHKNMLVRCLNPEHPAYHNYGGRGIRVNPDWMDYSNFVVDMGERPDGHELDRIDNNGGYYKDNCRWVTRRENLRNTSVNRLFEYNGVALCVAEIADMAGIPYHRAYTRLTKYGFDVAQTLKGYK